MPDWVGLFLLIVYRLKTIILAYEDSADEIWLATGSYLSCGSTCSDGCLSPRRNGIFAALGYYLLRMTRIKK